ncbi:hypothetical protein [Leptospira vanthielii]|uniref:Uncharacterized protein n=1 Tax=Leptospira vanthielii serovar Holland str. Waz Holland = ATCC 700522 TaxID=1218591 RepID=N1WD55_9LEPT|nr:hypothetical protein [Leptospira vanthielii]EMY71127.1 hypothetical protein LEP1GSC199_0135 [Leptospira vanthielii serovar Holland str. Waz Holland = ATCC 700522]
MLKPSIKENKIPNQYLSPLFCLLFVSLLHCGGDGYDKNKSKSNDLYTAILLSLPKAEENLPQPAMNTVEITVGDTKYTKTLGVCRGDLNVNGNDNIMVPGNDQTLPLFYLHKVDFTATTNVFLTPQGPTFIFNIDMPGGGGYDPAVVCETKILENSTTIYDIQVKNCAVDKIFGAVTPPTNTISFRARCTKGL